MSIFKEGKLSPEQQKAHDLATQLEHLWEKYAINSHPAELADYIELGGELSPDTRATVAAILRGCPQGNNADPYGALEAYSQINASLQWVGEPTTKEAAYILYAEGRNLTARGAKSKYMEGKKIAKEMGFA